MRLHNKYVYWLYATHVTVKAYWPLVTNFYILKVTRKWPFIGLLLDVIIINKSIEGLILIRLVIAQSWKHPFGKKIIKFLIPFSACKSYINIKRVLLAKLLTLSDCIILLFEHLFAVKINTTSTVSYFAITNFLEQQI